MSEGVPQDSASVSEPDAAASFGAHPVLAYTVKRVLLLAGVGGVLYLVGVRGLWLVLFAFLVSGILAMVVLKDSREGAAYGITGAVRRINERIDASARAEDIDDLAETSELGDHPTET